MIWCKNLYIHTYIYIYIYNESQEKRCQVFSTTEDVKLSYTQVEDVHIFTANYSTICYQGGNLCAY